MFCRNCGKELAEGEAFCQSCGFRAEPADNEKVQDGNSIVQNDLDNEKTGIMNAIKKIPVKWLIVAGVVIIIIFCTMLGGGSGSYIRMVRDGVLSGYDYGVCIDDALHKWFAGTEEWDCYEEDDNTFVIVSGTCDNTLSGESEQQTFYFKIIDDDHFRFLGAYTNDGEYICSTFGNGVADELAYSFVDWLSPLYEIDFYEEALKAAFGDEEAMETFRNIKE